MARARWSSKLIFLFAAVGSAVGLGNVWRFPYYAGKYGGGAFLVPYVIMLLVLGVPLLIMEFAIGQRMQLGAIGSLQKIRPKFSGIGLGAILCGFVVVSYYTVIIAWCLLYSIYSIDLKWGADTKEFFLVNVLDLSSKPGEIGQISVPILYALVAVWVLIYFSVWKGVRSVGKVVMVTMPLPVILLVVLAIRALFLPGGMSGVIYYLRPNFGALKDFELWSAAASQIFFTLSLAFGIMIAYASFRDRSSEIAKTAIVTSIINSGISIVAGLAVFATLGYMATESGVDVAQLAAKDSISISFQVFPKAFSGIPFAPLFAFGFFVMLITLGVDSAFSLVEAASTVIHDKYPHVRTEDLALYVCIVGLLSGIIFTTSAGMYYLDIVNHFITFYGLVIFGLLEVLAVGWWYGAENLRTYINEVSDIKIGKWWTWLIKFVIPVVLVVLLVTSFWKDCHEPYEGYAQWAIWCFGWGMLIVVFAVSFLFAHFSKADD